MSTEKDKRSTPKNHCRERSAPSKNPPGKTDKPHSAPLTRVLLSWLSRRHFLKHIGDVAKMVIAAIIAGRFADDNEPRPRIVELRGVATGQATVTGRASIGMTAMVEQQGISRIQSTSSAHQTSVSRITAAGPVEQREILASDSMTLSDDFRASIG